MQREKKRKRNGLGQNSAQTMPKALTSTCRLSLSLSQLSLSLYPSVSISLFRPEVQFVIGCDHESGQVSIPKRLKRKIQRKTGFPDTFVSMHLPATLMHFQRSTSICQIDKATRWACKKQQEKIVQNYS